MIIFMKYWRHMGGWSIAIPDVVLMLNQVCLTFVRRDGKNAVLIKATASSGIWSETSWKQTDWEQLNQSFNSEKQQTSWNKPDSQISHIILMFLLLLFCQNDVTSWRTMMMSLRKSCWKLQGFYRRGWKIILRTQGYKLIINVSNILKNTCLGFEIQLFENLESEGAKKSKYWENHL